MSVKRNVIASGLASAWAALIGLAFVPLYIRYLGFESYGLIGFFVTLQVWMSLLDMGLAPTLNREMARFRAGAMCVQGIRDLLKSMEGIYAALAVLLALLTALFAPWIATRWLNAQALPVEVVGQAVLVMGIVIACQWMATLYRSALLGLQQQVWLSAAAVVAATVRAAGTAAILAFVSPTIVAFFLFQGAVAAGEALVLGWRLRRCLPHESTPGRFSLEALRGVWRFAAGLTMVVFLATLLTQVDKLLLAKLLPLAQFGYFSLAVAVAGALSLMIAPINNVAFPRLTELVASGDEARLARQYHAFAQLLAMGLLPPTILLCLFSGEMLFVWTGDAATAAAVAPLLSIWVIGTALNGLMHIPYAAQLAHGWARLSVLLNAVAVLVMVPAVLWFVPRYGAIAAAWIWVAINAGYLSFGIAAMHKRILKGEKWDWYVRDTLVPTLAALAVAAPLAILHAARAPLGRLEELAFLVAAGLLLTAATVASVPLGRDVSRSALAGLRARMAKNA